MIEPFYVRQTADRDMPEGRSAWLKECAAEARGEGAQHARASAHETIPNLCLFEAWREPSSEVLKHGEGEPRWMLEAKKAP